MRSCVTIEWPIGTPSSALEQTVLIRPGDWDGAGVGGGGGGLPLSPLFCPLAYHTAASPLAGQCGPLLNMGPVPAQRWKTVLVWSSLVEVAHWRRTILMSQPLSGRRMAVALSSTVRTPINSRPPPPAPSSPPPHIHTSTGQSQEER